MAIPSLPRRLTPALPVLLAPAAFAAFAALAALAAFATGAFALERPAAGDVARYKRDGSFARLVEQAREIGNHRVAPRLVAGAEYRLRMELWRQGLLAEPPTPPPAWRGMPTTGTVRIFALLISFTDYAPGNTNASIDAKLFGDGSGNYPYESVRNFYRRSSYGLLELTGATLGWYAAPYPRSSVSQTMTGRQNLIKEALNTFEAAGHDFAPYDNNNDGEIDYFVVIWTGPPGAWASFWWGYQTTFGDGTYLLDGKRLRDYSWQWESPSPGGPFYPGVVIHETGHALGLPDYYDYNEDVGPDGGLGRLDQMDGNWGDHNCFSKFILDWITPTVYAGGANLATLRPSGTQKDAVLFAKGATSSPFTEYFMVQNRNQTGNDAGHPGRGLLAWHVDARLNSGGTNYEYDNSWADHKLIRLMEADGLEEIETGNGMADAGDYYVAGRTLPTGGFPSTARYDGTPNPMQLTGVSAAGDPMTAHIDEVADASPPFGAPGTPVDTGATTPLYRLPFTWTPGSAADPETGIAGYRLQVGTTPGASNAFDGWVGWATSRTVTNVTDGNTYYARVQAVNGAGLGSAWSGVSDGIAVAPADFSCTAVDNCGLAFKTGGHATWLEQGAVVYYGPTAAQSGPVADGESTYAQTTVTGPGTLRFFWRCSSEPGWDFLRVYVDGAVSGSALSGEVGWTERTITLGAGPHTVKWVYSKDEYCCVSGSDAGWVDRVQWLPAYADLRVTKSNGTTQLFAGRSTTWTIQVTNAGPEAAVGARVVDALPAALANATWTCTASGGALCPAPSGTGSIDRLVDLAAGSSVTFALTAAPLPSASGTIANTATVTAPLSVSDPSPGDNTATDTDTVVPLALWIDDAAVVEGSGGTTPLAFTVAASHAMDTGWSFSLSYATANGTAVAPGDFAAASGVVVLTGPGYRSAITVSVVADTAVELDETLTVGLSGGTIPISRSQGTGTIVDDDAPPLGTRELVHGAGERQDLAAVLGVADTDYFAVAEEPRSSYEVVVDGVSGDLVPLGLVRLGSDGATVLTTSQAVGTGGSLCLRFRNPLSTRVTSHAIRVSSGGCTTACGADDAYTIRFYETTGSIPRFNNGGTQVSVLMLQNATDGPVAGQAYFWSPAGVLLASHAFSLGPRQTLTLNTSTVTGLAGQAGTVTIAHDGGYGALTGKAVALEPATGFSFDSPLVLRSR